MRPDKATEETGRIEIVKYIVEPRTCQEIADLSGRITAKTVKNYMYRLRDRGIEVNKTTNGRTVSYQLVTPLDEALDIIKPTKYCVKVQRKRDAEAIRQVTKRPHKVKEVYIPVGEYHNWFGILVVPQAIDCRLAQ